MPPTVFVLKCNNGENKFALQWNETGGWYLLVFVARPCLLCQRRLWRALLRLTLSPPLPALCLPPRSLPQCFNLSSVPRVSTGNRGRATSCLSISPRWRSGLWGPCPAGRGDRWRPELHNSFRISQAAPPLEMIISMIIFGASVYS